MIQWQCKVRTNDSTYTMLGPTCQSYSSSKVITICTAQLLDEQTFELESLGHLDPSIVSVLSY